MAAFEAYRGRRPAEAKRLCQAILATNPDLVEIRVLDAVLVGEEGRNEDSIRMLREVLEFAPDSVEALGFLAGNFRMIGRNEEALEVADKLIALAPGRMEGYINRGIAHLNLGRFEEAADSFERASAIAPKKAVVHRNLGIANAKMLRFPVAEAALRKAAQLDPNSAKTFAMLADVVDKQRRTQEAIKLYRRVWELEPDSETGAVNLGTSLLLEERAEEAEQFLRSALNRMPHSVGIRTLLSSVLQQLGRFEEANAEARLAIEAEPGLARPYSVMVASAKVRQEDRLLVEKLSQFVSLPDQGMEELASIHYALGKAHDDLGEYGTAIEHYDAANALMSRRHWPNDLSTEPQVHEAVARRFSGSVFERNLDLGATTDQPIFIVGMIRSGTTLTEQILSSHPDVGAAGETSYWMHLPKVLVDGALKSPRILGDLQKGFLELIQRRSPGTPRITEKMPLNYLRLGLIHMAFPNARIIHCRRKPIDTCLSIYVTQFRGGLPFGHDRGNIVRFYKEYLRLMDHWRNLIPTDRMIEIDYETIVSDRESAVRKMLEFCGLTWSEACLHPERNVRAVNTPSLWQVRQPVYRTSVERWRRYEPWLREFRELLTPEDLASIQSVTG